MSFDNIMLKQLNCSSLKLSKNLELSQPQNTVSSQILATICHQLRNQLNVIYFSNSLIQRNLDKSNQEIIISCAENIQIATQEITKTLDNIYLLLQIEAGKVNLTISRVNLLKFCQDIIKKTQIIHGNRKINITVKGNYSQVHIYQPILEPILDNLIDNALKYSPSNSTVNLIITCKHQQITFTIKDKGIGILANDQKQLFQPFYRGENTNNFSGSGLGLSIVKNLVDLYQGKIYLVSKECLGTTVTLVIPSINDPESNTS
ncbi:MAG: sensor histidine kinase [Nostocales cyanobacterium]|nr:MAG: sensor histidine kinase [Nostocales cyanobacterium]